MPSASASWCSSVDVGEFALVQGGDDLAPEHAGLHHIVLLGRGHLVAALAREIEGDAADALDFVGVVDLGVDAALLAVAEIDDLLGFAEIDAAGQFAHDHDVEALDDFALERRGVGERGVADRRAQIGVEREFLAQPQQPGFRPHFVGNAVPFRAADRGEQDGVGALGARHVGFADRLAVSVIGAAADQALLDLEARASLAREKRW